MPENTPAPVGFDPPNHLQHLSEQEANELLNFLFREAMPTRQPRAQVINAGGWVLMAALAVIAAVRSYQDGAALYAFVLVGVAGFFMRFAGELLSDAIDGRRYRRIGEIADAHDDRAGLV